MVQQVHIRNMECWGNERFKVYLNLNFFIFILLQMLLLVDLRNTNKSHSIEAIKTVISTNIFIESFSQAITASQHAT